MTIEAEINAILNKPEEANQVLVIFARHLDRVENYMAWAKEVLERAEERANRSEELAKTMQQWRQQMDSSFGINDTKFKVPEGENK